MKHVKTLLFLVVVSFPFAGLYGQNDNDMAVWLSAERGWRQFPIKGLGATIQKGRFAYTLRAAWGEGQANRSSPGFFSHEVATPLERSKTFAAAAGVMTPPHFVRLFAGIGPAITGGTQRGELLNEWYSHSANTWYRNYRADPYRYVGLAVDVRVLGHITPYIGVGLNLRSEWYRQQPVRSFGLSVDVGILRSDNRNKTPE